jgi:hypothetical protein
LLPPQNEDVARHVVGRDHQDQLAPVAEVRKGKLGSRDLPLARCDPGASNRRTDVVRTSEVDAQLNPLMARLRSKMPLRLPGIELKPLEPTAH